MSHVLIVSPTDLERALFYMKFILSQYTFLALSKPSFICSVRKTPIRWSQIGTKVTVADLPEANSVTISSLLPYILIILFIIFILRILQLDYST